MYVDGKPFKQWSSVSEPGDFEHPFFATVHGTKLELLWDAENESEILKLNGVVYGSLPYLDETFRKS